MSLIVGSPRGGTCGWHTEPRLIVLLGVRAEVDCEVRRLRLLEPAVV